MNNLTTRKIVLGMLMMLVLTFSVQGIADALTSLRKATDDSGDGAIIRVSSSGNTFIFTIAGVNRATTGNDDADELTLTLSKGNIGSVTGGTLAVATGVVTSLSDGNVTVIYDAPDTTGKITLTVSHTQKNPNTSTQSRISFSATVVGELTLTKSSNISTSRDHQTQVENRRLVNPLTFTISNVADDDTLVIGDVNGNTGEITINRIVIGSTEVYENATGARSVTLDADATSNDQKLINGTAKVYCTLGGAGEQTLMVAGLSEDFMAYAVQSRNDVESDVNGINFSPANAEILYDAADQTATVALAPATTHVEVEFGISGGSLYHPDTPASNDFETTTTSRLTRFTASNGQVTVKFRPSSRSNVQITARVVLKRELEAVKTYYYGDAVLDKVSGDDQTGRPNTQLTQPLVVNVENQGGTGVSGQVVLFSFAAAADFSFSTPNVNSDRKMGTFRAVPGTTIYDSNTIYDNTNGLVEAEDHPSFRDEKITLSVVSDSRGEAKVYVVLTDGDTSLATNTKYYYQPMAKIDGFTHSLAIQKFKATADPGRSRDTQDIRIISGGTQNVAVRKYADPLEVIVESDGNVVQGAIVEFETNRGVLEFDSDENFGTQVSVTTSGTDRTAAVDTGFTFTGYLTTDASGRASVNYYVGETSGVGKVDATIRINPTETPTTRETFTVNVGGARDTTTTTTTTTTTETDDEEEEEEEETETLPGSLSIDVTGTGATRSITVTATDGVRNIPGVTVTLRGSALTQGQQTFTVGTPITITLPTAPGDYNLEAAANGFTTSPVETFTVTDGSAPGTPAPTSGGRTLTVEKDGAQTGTQQLIRVRATPAPSRNLAFTVTRGGFSVGTGVILTTGTGTAIVTVPATGLYVLTVSAEGYTPKQVTFTAGTGTLTVSETPTAGDPSRIEIDGASTRSGTEGHGT